jgi:hypothetical protein
MLIRMHFKGAEPTRKMEFQNGTAFCEALYKSLESVTSGQRAQITALYIYDDGDEAKQPTVALGPFD